MRVRGMGLRVRTISCAQESLCRDAVKIVLQSAEVKDVVMVSGESCRRRAVTMEGAPRYVNTTCSGTHAEAAPTVSTAITGYLDTRHLNYTHVQLNMLIERL
jgi:hypothetical protein